MLWAVAKSKENIGDILYELLDNAKNGKGNNIIQEMSDNESDVNAWNWHIDAVAYNL